MSNEVQKFTRRKGPLDLFLILLLMCAFAGFALILVSIGTSAYKTVLSNVETTSELRLPLSYISNKIHQGDQAGAIRLEHKEDITALVINSTEKNASYENWIFALDGGLYEVLVKAGDDFKLSNGIKVMDISKFEIQMKSNNLVSIKSYNILGDSQELSINIRSN